VTDAEILDLYERSLDDVYRYASRLCAGDRHQTDELVHETYASLVAHVRRHPLASIDSGWLMVTCRHRFLDGLRREHRRAKWESAAFVAPQSLPEADRATAALASVPADQRSALILRYVDDLPVPEVARAMGRSVHATESLLARGRVSLKDAVVRHEEADRGRS
jgi:RNA polymerase sigma-70 factor, ECF subfamily